MIDESSSTPIAPNLERHHIVDALRGFAIFGILVVNLPLFATPIYLQLTGEHWYTGEADRLVASGVIALFQGKFITLFAMLFGFGLALQGERMDARGLPLWPLYLRRQGVLLLIGLVHALLFWYGDILVTYAFVGILLLPLRRIWIWLALVGALGLASLMPAMAALGWLASFFPEGQAAIAEQATRSRELYGGLAADARATYLEGSFGEILAYNFVQWKTVMGFVVFYVWGVVASFLIGLVAGRVRVLQESERWMPRLRRWLPLTLPVGVLGSIAIVIQYRQADMFGVGPVQFFGTLAQSFAVPAMTITYVTIFLMLWHDGGERVMTRLAPVGRMALSNYLAHTLICTTLFNGYGGGLYGRLGPAVYLAMAVAIFALQIPFSAWWLSRFRFGPVEWLWRSATYGRLQPFRRA